MRQRKTEIVASLIVLFAIGLGAAGGFGILGMGAGAQVAFAILLVGATLWSTEAVPLFVTSLFILLLCLVWLVPEMEGAGEPVAASQFLAPFFSDIILLFLGGFVLAAGLRAYRLDEDLARWILDKAKSSVPMLLVGIMGITAFLSMWLSNTATTAMMLALCLPIAQRFPVDDGYRKAVLLSVPLSANVGGLGTPIGTPPNAIAMQYLERSGLSPSFGAWLLIGLPGVVVMLAVAWLTLMLLYRGNVSTVPAGPPAEERRDRFSAVELFVMGTCLVTAVGWTTSGWHGLSSGTVGLFPVIAFFALRILTVRDLRGLSWDVLLVMGGGLCLGRAVELSGLADWIIARLPTEGLGGFGMAAVFGVVACAMSSMISNTATANLIMPIIVGLGVDRLGPLLIAVAFACSLAMPLPISTPPNAMAFSTGELVVKDILRPGLIVTVIGLALALTTGYWFWNLVGVF